MADRPGDPASIEESNATCLTIPCGHGRSGVPAGSIRPMRFANTLIYRNNFGPTNNGPEKYARFRTGTRYAVVINPRLRGDGWGIAMNCRAFLPARF